MKQVNLLVAAAALALLGSGCAPARYVVTRIETQPPGARIEVNGRYLGAAPVDVTLPQTPNRHKLKTKVVIVALPAEPGQNTQTKVLRRHVEAPDRVFFDMTLPIAPEHAPSATPPQPRPLPAPAAAPPPEAAPTPPPRNETPPATQ